MQALFSVSISSLFEEEEMSATRTIRDGAENVNDAFFGFMLAQCLLAGVGGDERKARIILACAVEELTTHRTEEDIMDDWPEETDAWVKVETAAHRYSMLTFPSKKDGAK